MKKPLAQVVENDVHHAKIIGIILQEAGYEVKHCYDGLSAFEYLLENTPDLIILDIHLPQASGEVVAWWVKSEPSLSQTEMVVVTADPQVPIPLSDHIAAVMIKPFSPLYLSQVVKDLTASFIETQEQYEN